MKVCIVADCPEPVARRSRCARHAREQEAARPRSSAQNPWQWQQARARARRRDRVCRNCGAPIASVHHRNGRSPRRQAREPRVALQGLPRRTPRPPRGGIGAPRPPLPHRSTPSAAADSRARVEVGHGFAYLMLGSRGDRPQRSRGAEPPPCAPRRRGGASAPARARAPATSSAALEKPRRLDFDPRFATPRVARRTHPPSVSRRATPVAMRDCERWGHRGDTRLERCRGRHDASRTAIGYGVVRAPAQPARGSGRAPSTPLLALHRRSTSTGDPPGRDYPGDSQRQGDVVAVPENE
jgi:hypothetical protein